jgi:NADPH:quinone reductase-like Zn-dependent oxidoreductase
MKEVIVHPLPDIKCEIHEVDIPVPESDQVVIKVAVAGSNVKGSFLLLYVAVWQKSHETFLNELTFT